MTVFRWAGIASPSLEHLEFTQTESPRAVSWVIANSNDGVFRYEIECDPAWACRSLVLEATSSRRVIRLAVTNLPGGAREWTVDGRLRPTLRDAVDVDLPITPFTNTLPIRRLKLGIGETAEIVTAYVSIPSLEVTPDPQRYTRQTHDTYLYESLDTDFRSQISVDAQGFVLDYPGLFKRTS